MRKRKGEDEGEEETGGGRLRRNREE